MLVTEEGCYCLTAASADGLNDFRFGLDGGGKRNTEHPSAEPDSGVGFYIVEGDAVALVTANVSQPVVAGFQ